MFTTFEPQDYKLYDATFQNFYDADPSSPHDQYKMRENRFVRLYFQWSRLADNDINKYIQVSDLLLEGQTVLQLRATYWNPELGAHARFYHGSEWVKHNIKPYVDDLVAFTESTMVQRRRLMHVTRRRRATIRYNPAIDNRDYQLPSTVLPAPWWRNRSAWD